MRVFNHKEMYKELVEYICSKCNIICVNVRDYEYDETPKVIEILLKKTNNTMEDVISNYSEKYLDDLYNYFVEDEEIFDKTYIKKYGRAISYKSSNINIKDKEMRRYWLETAVNYIIYNYNTSMWLRKYKQKTILKRKSSHSTEYYIKLNDALKKELHEKKSFLDWEFPYFVEGICFYKDERCLLKSSYGRWRYVNLYPENEREYKYLKSIGIQFDEKKFEPISKLEAKCVNRSELINLKY